MISLLRLIVLVIGFAYCATAGIALSESAESAEGWTVVNLNSLIEFEETGSNWSIAGAIGGDPRHEKELVTEAGVGLLVNKPSAIDSTESSPGSLFTSWEHGDIELELEFLLTVDSNSGIYLQGRYEVQICDTWNHPRRPSHDTGSIYQRWDTSRPKGQEGYEGHAPLMATERAPGLWQHMRIMFRAPRFDAEGVRVSPARFERIELNGVLVQQNVEVYGPTRVAAFNDEEPVGPIMLQGDHGAVAFRNIRYRTLPSESKSAANTTGLSTTLLNPNTSQLIEQGTSDLSGNRRIEGVAVGSPDSLHYTYSADRGALLQMWRGAFLLQPPGSDYAGTKFRFHPGGSVIEHSGRPTMAWLRHQDDPWPKAASRDASQGEPAWRYDDQGLPVFLLSSHRRSGTEQIIVRADRHGLTRRIVINAPDPALSASTGATWLLLAEAAQITDSSSGFVIGDREYYLDLPYSVDWTFTIRKGGAGYQLIALVPDKRATLTYHLIW